MLLRRQSRGLGLQIYFSLHPLHSIRKWAARMMTLR